MFNPHPCQSLSMMNQNLKSPKSSTPRLTTNVMPASYCILSVGQGMRTLTKKLPGSSLPSLEMLLNLLQIYTLHIQPSLVLFQVFDLGTLQFLKSYFKFSHFTSQPNSYYNLYYSLIVESWSSTPAPKPNPNLGLSFLDTHFAPLGAPRPPPRWRKHLVSNPWSHSPPTQPLTPPPPNSSFRIPPFSTSSFCFHLETWIPPTV